jgi:hypothetical protein
MNAFKIITGIILFVACAVLAGSTALAADGASIFLASGYGVYEANKTFKTYVMINSGGGAGINAVESTLRFDPKYLTVQKVSIEGSFFRLWIVKPKVNAKAGTIQFSGGLPGGYKQTFGIVFNIDFLPIKQGRTVLTFATSSILSADGTGLEMLKGTSTAIYYLKDRKAVLAAANMVKSLSGRIVLQVEKKGEAWYIYPKDNRRYFLGRPADAFNVMRKLGLGTTHKFITAYKIFPKKMSGRILLDVEKKGEAYYINPLDMKSYYLGRPADAFQVMRKLGLGISEEVISMIPDWGI